MQTMWFMATRKPSTPFRARHEKNEWRLIPERNLRLTCARRGPTFFAEADEALRPRACRASHAPLQHPYRGGLRRLDPAVHPLPRQTEPRRNGRSRDQRLRLASRHAREGGRFHPDAGPERASLPLPRSLGRPVESLGDVVRAKRPERLPVVLTRDEVRAVLARLDGTPLPVATLLYGTGLRLMECLRLRVKDVDFALNQILVRDGKGMKDRLTMLPVALRQPLQRHLVAVKALHEADLREGFGSVYRPDALARKYPAAAKWWGWQWIFPAASRSADPRAGAGSPLRRPSGRNTR